MRPLANCESGTGFSAGSPLQPRYRLGGAISKNPELSRLRKNKADGTPYKRLASNCAEAKRPARSPELFLQFRKKAYLSVVRPAAFRILPSQAEQPPFCSESQCAPGAKRDLQGVLSQKQLPPDRGRNFPFTVPTEKKFEKRKVNFLRTRHKRILATEAFQARP